jgi:tRNA dimethylallyltransferase
MKIPVILGPTAVGKSEFALRLCREINGEIISCDSRQIYRLMNIGTGKVSFQSQQEIPHHLIDIIPPSEPFSAALWAQKARNTIIETAQRNRCSVLCGGTFFYYHMLSSGSFCTAEAHTNLRKKFLAREKAAPGTLYQELVSRDPHRAEDIHPNDTYRLMRALETLSSVSYAEYSRSSIPSGWEFIPIVLYRDREILYRRINARTDAMMEAGLYDEFQNLLSRGYDNTAPGMKCVGYGEFFNYIHRKCTMDDAVADIKKHSRRYAKRQLTWLRNKLTPSVSISVDEGFEEGIQRVIQLLQ